MLTKSAIATAIVSRRKAVIVSTAFAWEFDKSARAAEFLAKMGESATEAFVRLAGRADGVTVYWVMRGVRYLWSGSREPIPLYHVDMLTAVKCTAIGNGDYLIGVLENSYSSDLRTGEVIKTFQNPLTGRTEEFWTGSPYPPGYYTLTASGQKVHKVGPLDDSLTLKTMTGGVRIQRSFDDEKIVEDRWNDIFTPVNGVPAYASVAVHYKTASLKLIKNGACYDNVSKTHVISRHWPYEGGEKLNQPQLFGVYSGRRYLSSEETFAVPGVQAVETIGPGTLKAIAEF